MNTDIIIREYQCTSVAISEIFTYLKIMQRIINNINQLAGEIKKNITLMEVCGTHTEVIAKHGLRKILPKNIKLISGPGCPVCVTDQRDIDNIIELALQKIPIVTYGDMIKVPGNKMSLEQAVGQGAKIFSVYSTEEIFTNPEIKPFINELVFFGIGFDTTTPMTASIIKRGIAVYSTHKKFFPAMKALLENQEIKIDGFINPGHVSTIIGSKPYQQLKLSQVIAGFKPEDVLIAIYLLLKQIKGGKGVVENEYQRVVKTEGNLRAQKLINEVFEIKNTNWRGFGQIPKSGYEIRKKYQKFNAKIKYRDILDNLKIKENPKLKLCRCDEVIKGLIEPNECKLFSKSCLPENPVGPCMVSREGACNIKYRFK